MNQPVATPDPQRLSAVAPWLESGDPVLLTAEDMKQVLPNRHSPLPVERVDATALWREIRPALAEHVRFDLERCDPSLREAIEAALQQLQNDTLDADGGMSDTVLLCLAVGDAEVAREQQKTYTRYVRCLIARRGLTDTLELLLATQHWRLQRTEYQYGVPQSLYLTLDDSPSPELIDSLVDSDSPLWELRHQLAAASEPEWRTCVERLRAALPSLPPHWQIALALMAPDAPELAEAVVERLAGTAFAGKSSYLLPNLRDPATVARIVAGCPAASGARDNDMDYGYWGLWGSDKLLLTLLHARGSSAQDLLIPGIACNSTLWMLPRIGTPEVVLALARATATDEFAGEPFATAIARWPLAALAGLSGPLLVDNDKRLRHLRPQFTNLLQNQADNLPRLLPWLSPKTREALRREAGQLNLLGEQAGADELPGVLIDPPWLRPRTTKPARAISLQPLDQAPAMRHEATAQGKIESPTVTNTAVAKHLAYALEFDDPHAAEAAQAILQGDIPGLLGAWDRLCKRESGGVSLNASDVLELPEALAIALWSHVAERHTQCCHLVEMELVLARYGLQLLPALRILLNDSPAQALPHLGRFGYVAIAPHMASTLARRRSANRLSALQWLLAWPEHAACGLIAPAVGKRCEARNHAATALRLLASHGHEALILEVAARYGNPKVVEAVRALLAEDPLDLFPEKIAPLPEFWQPKQWTRLQLRDSGKLLPPEKLDALGQMMSFPTAGGLYPGLEQIRQACTPDSLAAFVWDCFLAWTQHGAAAKENWAMLMLGHLGNDDSARELMAWINRWTLNSAVHRAVAALEVLVSLGSDRSLTLLDRLSRKAPSTKLRQCALERIRSIAEIRGLSEEELADRLVPTCDLDERSSLQLDFGPRQFTVVFDEQLQPWVRDADGARLPTLPKANKTDDAQKSKAAASRFRRLKKEVGTIASEQLRRLESAMCNRRRWQAEAFRNCLAEHPLLRHLVQRLVWGVYEIEGLADEQSGCGGRLLQCFRIAEDGSITDTNDDPLTLPEDGTLRFGLPHQLELPAETTTAFAQLFADYQLLQPFAQLGRDTYALSAEERSSGLIARHQGARVPNGRIFALTHRGWQRDMYHCSKPLDGGRLALLEFHPGLSPEESEKVQTLDALQIGTLGRTGEIPDAALSAEDLDPITASELIRDLEYLCA